MANELVYQVEREINDLYDDFFKLLPIEVSDITAKIEQIENLKIFFTIILIIKVLIKNN